MKSIKIFFLATLAVVVGVFSACSNSDFEAGPEVAGAQIYFPESIEAQYKIDEGETSFSIPIKRIVKETAQTVAILAEDESGLFTIPASVTFAAGQESAELVVTFDQSKLDNDKEYPLSFLINDEDNTTPYGNRTLDITAAIWPWKLMEANDGKGKYREDFLTTLYGVDNSEVEITVYEHKSKKGIYMIEEMFGWPLLTTIFDTTQADIEANAFTYTPTNITINCSDPNAVFFPRQFTGLTNIDASVGKVEIATFTTGNGTLADGVITFPQNGLAFVCTAGNYTSNSGGKFRIVLPGYEAVDYSLTATYDGMKTSADGETVSAVIDFAYGTDVTGISFVFADGDVTADADEYAAKIADGTAENITKIKDLSSGDKSVSIESELSASGLYTVIAVPDDKAKKPRVNEVSAVSFYFPGNGGAAPDCDIAAKLYKVSEYPDAAKYVTEYPDYSCAVWELTGTDIKTVKILFNLSDLIDQVTEAGTLQQIMNAYGEAITGDALTALTTTGKYWDIATKLDSENSYKIVVEATNTYGKKALIVSDPITTTAIPYSGEFVIGKYQMVYQASAETKFENVFTVKATPSSNTAFTVHGIGYDDGTAWYATYDPTASTLTLSGIQVGREEDGNLFGVLTTYADNAKTQAYGVFSFKNQDSNGDDPLVLTVNASNKQLSKLNNQLQVPVITLSTEEVAGYVGLFAFDTPVTKYTASSAAGSAKAKVQRMRSVNIPFSSVRVPVDMKSLFDNRVGASARTTADFVTTTRFSDSGIRTLDVKTAKCEPLPRQLGMRTDFKINETFQALK